MNKILKTRFFEGTEQFVGIGQEGDYWFVYDKRLGTNQWNMWHGFFLTFREAFKFVFDLPEPRVI